mgnify:CR=1 FL=1
MQTIKGCGLKTRSLNEMLLHIIVYTKRGQDNAPINVLCNATKPNDIGRFIGNQCVVYYVRLLW